ncbi:MAG: hypothetical protein ACE5HJ_01500 [Thermoplasmata archaeon]
MTLITLLVGLFVVAGFLSMVMVLHRPPSAIVTWRVILILIGILVAGIILARLTNAEQHKD